GRFTAAELAGKIHQIKIRCERQLFHVHLPLQRSIVIRSSERKVRIDCRANALRVQNTHALTLHRQIETKIRTVNHSALSGDSSASNLTFKLCDVEPVASERQHSVAVSQTQWRSGFSKARIHDSHLSLDVGIRTLSR